MRFRLINEKFDYLCELAYDRQKILHDLENSVDYIVEHLIQLFMFRNTQDFEHWISEVYRGCHKMPKWSGSKKYLPFDDIKQRLWSGWSDSYDNYIEGYLNNVAYKEHAHIPEFNDNNLYNFIQDYFEWLATQLSISGFITLENCKNKISELLNNYKLI